MMGIQPHTLCPAQLTNILSWIQALEGTFTIYENVSLATHQCSLSTFDRNHTVGHCGRSGIAVHHGCHTALVEESLTVVLLLIWLSIDASFEPVDFTSINLQNLVPANIHHRFHN